jgi:hypothetical protein
MLSLQGEIEVGEYAVHRPVEQALALLFADTVQPGLRHLFRLTLEGGHTPISWTPSLAACSRASCSV